MKRIIFRQLPNIFFSVLCLVFIFLALRGQSGNPVAKELNTSSWKEDGPFELSPERGRFALTYSIVEDHSFYFSVPIAKFIIPDLGYKNGHYVSLFAPGVSFIAIPGYLVGRLLGVSQVGAFAFVSLFAILNFVLIKLISKALKASEIASWLAALVFLFATPSFPFPLYLYQHHISTFLILLATYIIIKAKRIWPLFFVWLLCAASISVDYPNLVLMFPIGVCAFFKMIHVQNMSGAFKVKIPITNLLVFVGVIFPLLFFMWFNYKSYGNPFQFSGTVASVREIDSSGNPAFPKTADPEHVDEYLHPEEQKKSVIVFFSSRAILNGLYMHFVSPDRGIIAFAPVILFGIFGVVILFKQKSKFLPVLLGILGADLVLYSMWGDPWGGWAFGSRYLIPAYAIMAIFISTALTNLKTKKLFMIPFYILLVYSIAVNTLGALTSNANPPKVEVLELEKLSGKQERYSFDRNWEFLISGRSKSFVFQTYAAKYMTSVQYYYLITWLITALSTGMVVLLWRKNE